MDFHLRLKGYVGGWDFDSDYTSYILDKYKGQPVNVCIDSLGGMLNTALSISAMFKQHGDVSVHYCGMNASAATIVSLGAKHVSIDRDAWYMVHRTSFSVPGGQMNEARIEEYIKELDEAKAQLQKYDIGIAKAYARRCKKSPEELYALMEKDQFISAEEALEWGFVDEITDYPEDAAPIIDEVTESYCNENGIALPACVARKSQMIEKSFVDRIVASVKSAFTPNTKNKMEKEPKTAEPQNEVEQTTSTPENSTEQPEANKELLDQIAQLKAENADLKAKLEKEPAEEQKGIVDDAKPKAKNKAFRTNFTKSASDLFNALP